ncbi:hypothetical protein H9L17_02650 [Thermomonas brevis]|uniref:Uncharacterized protein n=1 Tax=Thermomonas brevis TaxID=215691 RepID=A0A7G9QUR0_9GAMM|nr:hypothetical protein [Thermomonas brevis]QNN47085.1 hypothetical protein H9L17_02650 [Thermomonas brevis]
MPLTRLLALYAQIRTTIVRTRDARDHVVYPHTACAAEVLDRVREHGE